MKRPTETIERAESRPEACGCGHDHESHEEHEHHHHHHEAGCGCGHDHEEHEHHHHHHEAGCGCGHDHEEHEEHHHHHEAGCGCGHDHGDHEVHEHYHGGNAGSGKSVFILENLGCAHCAAKMEEKISSLPGVEEAVLTYATKQLRLTAAHPESYLEQIREICRSIEPDVEVHEKESGSRSESGKREQAGRGDDAESAAPEKRQQAGARGRKKLSGEGKALLAILAGAVLFAAGEILEHTGAGVWITIPIYVAAYVILGIRIVWTALRNLTRGHVFDENFLMSVATLGAFAIQEYPEAVGVMLFYRIGEFFEDRAVAKSRSQIMDAVDMRPEVVNLVSGHEIRVIRAEEAGKGDVLLVRPGDRIPLDGVILEGESRIDTSPITGEPVPVHVKPGDPVTSGCVNTAGQLKIRAEKALEESMVTRILDSVENAAASKPKIDRFITRFARIYTPVVVFLALATAVIPSLVTGDWDYWVYTALSFLVMSCPCALVLSVPLSFFSGIGAGSKKGILFKGGSSIEAMSAVKAVVMDKTGTITEGNFEVQQIIPAKESRMTADELLYLCAVCEQNSTHPIAASIVAAARKQGGSLEEPESLEEIAGHGIRAVFREQQILCGNRKLMERFGVFLEEPEKETAGSEVYVAVDGLYAGSVTVADTIKKDAGRALSSLKKMNVATAMLTGDREESARAVAREIGLDEVRAKLLPEEKLTELQKLREKYGAVMFVGDGINDAPVLAGADVGAAMGSGADAAIEAADVVFMTSAVEAIPQSLRIARSTKRISWQNVIFALAVKVAVMTLGLCGFASMWAAVFADTGVAMICVLNSVRILYKKQ